MGSDGPAQTYTKKSKVPHQTMNSPKEWKMRDLQPVFNSGQKINFPQIQYPGDSSSTYMFHGEHFSSQIKLPRAFHSLFTAVDIFQVGNYWF